MSQVVNPHNVIRIVLVDPPMHFMKGEGIYEWRRMEEKFYVDVIDAEKEINKVMPGKGEAILDRLQNFKKVFINLDTGEVTT